MAAAFTPPLQMAHRLTLQSRNDQVVSGGEDAAAGELMTNWTNVANLWGALLDSQVRWREEGQQMSEVTQHRVIIRYRDDVTSGWRFLLDERELSILTVVDPDQSQRFLNCLCEEAAR